MKTTKTKTILAWFILVTLALFMIIVTKGIILLIAGITVTAAWAVIYLTRDKL